MKQAILSLFCIFLISVTFGQLNVNDSTLHVPMFYASYAVQFPRGDLADRYGINSNIGGGFKWKTDHNWLFGADFSFIFGNAVKNEGQYLTNLKTESGNIIDLSGGFAAYSLMERGYFVSMNIGKLIPVLSPNPNSGILIQASAGYFQHKLRIEVLQNAAPQLRGDYKKGYDRLTGGFGINEFIGYMYLSNSRLVNFYAGFEFTQAWTQPYRDVYFDTRKPDPLQNRVDLLNGFKVGWIIPIFERQPEKFYLY